MEKTTLYAYIIITGNDDFPLEVVTESLGVQPTRTWKVGESVNAHTPLKRFYTGWKYQSEQLETLDAEDVLRPLFATFNDKVGIINQLKKEFNLDVQIQLVIEIKDGQTPGIVISPEFSGFASAINAFIHIDMYAYSFNDSEEM